VTVLFGRQATGWEVAYAALFLISNESSYANATRCSSMPTPWPGSCAANRFSQMAQALRLSPQCTNLPRQSFSPERTT
jgi:hypothetical protein